MCLRLVKLKFGETGGKESVDKHKSVKQIITESFVKQKLWQMLAGNVCLLSDILVFNDYRERDEESRVEN